MSFVVTGGAGFIGSNLIHKLLELGEVTILDDLSTGNLDNVKDVLEDVTFIKSSITDINTLKSIFHGKEVVFHVAALPNVSRSVLDPLTTHNVNITGTLNVLIAARDEGVKKVIFSSSSSVYGDTIELPKREDMIPKPISPYAVTKLAGEFYCKVFSDLYALETVSLRYFNVYGENQNPFSQYSAVIPTFISKLLSGERPVIDGDGCQTRDFTYVKDVVDANIKSIKKGITGVFNIAGGKNISINDLFEEVRKITEVDIEPIYGPPRLGDVRDSLADISKARIKLGFAPGYSLEDGLRETVDWYRKLLRK